MLQRPSYRLMQHKIYTFTREVFNILQTKQLLAHFSRMFRLLGVLSFEHHGLPCCLWGSLPFDPWVAFYFELPFRLIVPYGWLLRLGVCKCRRIGPLTFVFVPSRTSFGCLYLTFFWCQLQEPLALSSFWVLRDLLLFWLLLAFVIPLAWFCVQHLPPSPFSLLPRLLPFFRLLCKALQPFLFLQNLYP